MGQRARFFQGIIMINWIMTIQVIDSMTTNSTQKNTLMSLLDLSGSHVDVCCAFYEGFLNWKRNETGHVTSKIGLSVEMLDWLSVSAKFDYECLPLKDSEPTLQRDNETNTNVWTPLYRLKHRLCLVSPMPFVMTYDRFKSYCDFLSPFVYTPFSLLIPVPQQVSLGGISSVWRPFDVSVWIALLISVGITMFLSFVNWLYNRSTVINVNERDEVSLDLHWLFIFGLLMSKAGFRAPDSFKMRFTGGAWCIAALILTNFYSSILTSLITASIPVPIVNSVEELANNENVELVIVKNWGASAFITGGLDNRPLLKKLDLKLKSTPNSICSDQNECFRKVVERKATTFLHDEPTLLGLVSEDYHRTGRCNAAFAKEKFGLIYLSWAISKNYSQFETFQRGMLLMMETGLVDHWKYTYLPKPIQCLVDPSSRQAILADIRNPALVNLRGLVPAFLFLCIGFIIASISLAIEWVKKLRLWQFLTLFSSPSP